MQYAIRIPANKSLELEIEDILFRPPGRPSAKPLVRYKSFLYQAENWSRPRRIVAKVEHHPGELFPRVGFVVTNMSLPSRSVFSGCSPSPVTDEPPAALLGMIYSQSITQRRELWDVQDPTGQGLLHACGNRSVLPLSPPE